MSAIRAGLLAALLVQAPVAAIAQSAAPDAATAYPGVSTAGNATLAKLYRAPDPTYRMILGELKDVSAQLQLEGQRPSIDVDKITTLLRRREGLAAQSQTRRDDRVIAALKALAPEDRGPFLHAISRSVASPTPAPSAAVAH